MTQFQSAVSALVSAETVLHHLTDWRVLDATYYLGKPVSAALAQFETIHIPGARFFDIDGVADAATDLPHMLPSINRFETAVRQLGIQPTDTLVVYDAQGLFSAPRVWWTFRHFRHADVRILDGGLPAWQAAGYFTESGPAAKMEPSSYQVSGQPAQDVVDTSDLLAHLAQPQFKAILDARAADRFYAEVDEPRSGLRRGHIPGSFNLPWNHVVDPQTKRLRATTELRQALQQAGLSLDSAHPPSKPVICSCGSGMTACILGLVLHEVGFNDWKIYDGSWAEWGRISENLPIEPSCL